MKKSARVWKSVSLVLLACSGSPETGSPPSEEQDTEIPIGSPWSDPGSWPSGRVPGEGDNIVIPTGKQILLDVSPPPLGSITIQGTLVFDDEDLELSAKWIMVHGTLRVGHVQRAFQHQATLTLTDNNLEGNEMGMGTRGIMVMDGGTLDLHGTPPNKTWSKLADHVPAGSMSFQLIDEVDWKTGDQLVIAPTDYFRIGRTERARLEAVDGQELEVADPVERFRWGLLQYVDESGVTLAPTTSIIDSVLDERAEVGNLTRNIVVQGPDDELWREQGFGAHVMIMRESVGRFDGVEFRRVGQAGRVARYPVHWHLWSYASNDPEGIDATDQYVKNSAIWESANRCVVIHGTNGVTVSDNVCYDIRGHAIFLEDAVERRNVIENNLVLNVHTPSQENRILRHDDRPAGYWLTNPDNIVRGNVAADSEGMGYWLAYPEFPLGTHKNIPIQPSHLQFGEFSSNVAHSNRQMGMMFDDVPINDEGDVGPRHYRPTNTETEGGNTPVPYEMTGIVFYKHEVEWQSPSVSFWNRTHYGTFDRFVTADFNGTAFAGASLCTIKEALVIGSSLNNENEPQILESDSLTSPGAARLGAASYHSDCDILDNVFVNLPANPGKPSGAFGTSDYYITGVDKGLARNTNNRLINTHPGYRSVSPNNLAVGEGRQNYSLAGALWDPHGYWGSAGNYWVYDLPFLTDGTECSAPLEPHGNDRSCAGPYFGLLTFLLDGEDPYNSPGRTRPIRVTREDNGATWFIDDGDCTPVLGPMRNFSLLQGIRYRVAFPAGQTPGDAQDGTPGSSVNCDQMSAATPAPNHISFTITNLLEAEDFFILGVPFVGNVTPIVVATSRTPDDVFSWGSYSAYQSGDSNWQSAMNGQYWRPIEPGDNLTAVENSNGDRYWHDTANELAWIKVARMGITPVDDPTVALYQPISYLLRAE